MGGDFNAELGSGNGVERVSVGPHTLKEVNKRGDWMKQWLMIQNFAALNTMYRKTLGKQTTYRSPEGTEKQFDYIIDQKNTPEIQQRCRSHRHDPHEQRPQMCHGNIHDQCTKKNGPRDANNNKQRMVTMGKIRAQIEKQMKTKRHPRSKKEIKNSKKRSNKKPQL